MVASDPGKLRASAHNYRLMASDGDDLHLKVLLRQLAEDFEQEAAKLEEQAGGVTNDAG